MLVKAYGAHAGDKPLEPLQISHRTPAAHDVQIDFAFCGICHSDLHQVRAEWAGAEPGIVADIELIRADQINESYERMLKGDVRYRFVIDNATLAD